MYVLWRMHIQQPKKENKWFACSLLQIIRLLWQVDCRHSFFIDIDAVIPIPTSMLFVSTVFLSYLNSCHRYLRWRWVIWWSNTSLLKCLLVFIKKPCGKLLSCDVLFLCSTLVQCFNPVMALSRNSGLFICCSSSKHCLINFCLLRIFVFIHFSRNSVQGQYSC